MGGWWPILPICCTVESYWGGSEKHGISWEVKRMDLGQAHGSHVWLKHLWFNAGWEDGIEAQSRYKPLAENISMYSCINKKKKSCHDLPNGLKKYIIVSPRNPISRSWVEGADGATERKKCAAQGWKAMHAYEYWDTTNNCVWKMQVLNSKSASWVNINEILKRILDWW